MIIKKISIIQYIWVYPFMITAGVVQARQHF